MTILWSIVIALNFLAQEGFSPPANSALNAEEKHKIERKDDINDRIKIYRKASERMQDNIKKAASKDNYRAVPENLKLWVSLLSESLSDIEANLKSKKKSKELIKYEIQVRKAISNIQSYRFKAPLEQQDLFKSSLEQAEDVRKKFVEILFQRK